MLSAPEPDGDERRAPDHPDDEQGGPGGPAGTRLEALRAITKRGGRVLVPLIVNEAEDPANLAGVQQWTLRHLGEPISVDDLAARAVMSPRNLARQFAARTGTTPQAYRRTFSQTR